MSKVVFVLQGAPGSGKSTLAEKLAAEHDGVICSTDSYFEDPVTGEYKFDPTKLGEFHKKNQQNARKVMDQGFPVIVDNTNLRNWEAKPYVQAAKEFGYEVRFIRCDGGFQNNHGVPPEKVAQMRAAMEELSVEAALKSKAPWEK